MGHFCNKLISKLIYILFFILFIGCSNKKDIVNLVIFNDDKMEISDFNDAFLTNLNDIGFNTLLLDESLLTKEDDINSFLSRIYQYKVKVLVKISLDNIDVRRIVSYPIDGIVITEMGYSTSLQKRYKVVKNIYLQATKGYPSRYREPYLNMVLAHSSLSNAEELVKTIYLQNKLDFIDNRISQIFAYLKYYQFDKFLTELKLYYSFTNRHSYSRKSIKAFNYINDYNKDLFLMKKAIAIWANLSGSLLFISNLDQVFFNDYNSYEAKNYLARYIKNRDSNLDFKKANFTDKTLTLHVNGDYTKYLILLNFAFNAWDFKAKANNNDIWYNVDKNKLNMHAVNKSIKYKIDGNDAEIFFKK